MTFSGAPGAAVREVACEFYVPCRYGTDKVDGRLVHRRLGGEQFIEWADINIAERKE